MKSWHGDQTCGTQFYLVTQEAIYIDDIEEEIKAKQAAYDIAAGAAPASLLSKDVVHIPLVAVQRLAADLTRYEIEITYREGKDKETETLLFKTEAAFEDGYRYLRDLFGDKFSENIDEYNIPRAAYGSLWAFTIFGFLTWICYYAAAGIQEDGYEGKRRKAKMFAAILDWVGPTGVAIIGGIILVLIAVYLVSRIKKPPYYLILQQEPYKQTGMIRIGINYLILFGVWFVLARAML